MVKLSAGGAVDDDREAVLSFVESGLLVRCRYEARAPRDAGTTRNVVLNRAGFLACSDGRARDSDVLATRVELDVVRAADATPVTANAGLDELEPCAGDAGASASDAGSSMDAGGGGADAGAPPPEDAGAACSTDTACDDGNACTEDRCSSGACTHAPLPPGTSCSNGSACDGAEQCDGAGVCLLGTPPALDDGNPCTVDACDPAAGPVHLPMAAGTVCDDGNACTAGDTCNGAGACAAGAPLAVDDGNPCTRDLCDSVRGVLHEPLPFGDTACANASACDGVETCDGAGACRPGAPPPIDDGNACTLDTCNPATGPVHTPVAGCDPTPVQNADAALETRASLTGKVVTPAGTAPPGVSFQVFDERMTGAPRADVQTTLTADGSFRIRLTSFPESEPERSPAHRLVLVVEAPGFLRAYRTAYARPGEVVPLGSVRLTSRDPVVTNIGPEGGRAVDSRGLVEVVIPPGATDTIVPVQITPFTDRAEFPAPLPDQSVTMYGYELEPSGTRFAAPVTVRATNYRNAPTTLELPVGYFDPVDQLWDHEGSATWDGSAFASKVDHFSLRDANPNRVADLVMRTTRTPPPNNGKKECGQGSSWSVAGGALEQSFSLPSTRAGGADLGLSLHYASGLAGSRRLGSTTQTQGGAIPTGTLAVSVGGTKVETFCVARGGAAPSATQPGSCSTVVGSCGTGGVSFEIGLAMAALSRRELVTTAANATEIGTDGWFELPLVGDSVASPGFFTQELTVAAQGAGVCAGGGGSFAASDPLAPRTLLPTTSAGPSARITRKVLVNHRFTSPLGAGWAIREVSRAYRDGDFAIVVDGMGQEERFEPRARVRALPNGSGSHAFARDPVSGEVLVASTPGTISSVDVATGVRTPLLSGLAFPGGDEPLSLAVARVAGVRHFVVAFATRLVDFDAAGSARTLTTRGAFGRTIVTQPSVAARGSRVFYTDGDPATPVVSMIDLDGAAPALVALSSVARNADRRLAPRAPFGTVALDAPRGLTFLSDGSLLVADPRRNGVYRVRPDASGVVSASSQVELALGNGDGSALPSPGERRPGAVFSLNQPLRLSATEDDHVLVMTTYGILAWDAISGDAELLVRDGERRRDHPEPRGHLRRCPELPHQLRRAHEVGAPLPVGR